MLLIKWIILLGMLCICCLIGDMIARRYSSRVKELKEFNVALSIIESKINFTYEPLPEIFSEVSGMLNKNISQIFSRSAKYMKEENAQEAWNKSVEEVNNNFTKEDIENIRNFGKMLGQTDKEGQVNQLEMTQTLIEAQIKKAVDEEIKNVKLYKTLGTIVGIAFVIILI